MLFRSCPTQHTHRADSLTAAASLPPHTPSLSPGNPGGEGGGLYSDGRKKELDSSLLPSESHLASLSEALRDVGVYTLSRTHRERLAAELVAEGVAAQDVVDLAAYLGELVTEAAKAQRTIAGRLTTREQRREAFEDLRAHRAARLRAGADHAQTDDSYGAHLRRQDLARIRAFEESWRRYELDVAEGRVQRQPRRPHPWERTEERADRARAQAAQSELDSFCPGGDDHGTK